MKTQYYSYTLLRCKQILRRDIHLPELKHFDITKLADYPPRLLIYVQQVSADCSIPEVQVLGLDRECSFELAHLGTITKMYTYHNSCQAFLYTAQSPLQIPACTIGKRSVSNDGESVSIIMLLFAR